MAEEKKKTTTKKVTSSKKPSTKKKEVGTKKTTVKKVATRKTSSISDVKKEEIKKDILVKEEVKKQEPKKEEDEDKRKKVLVIILLLLLLLFFFFAFDVWDIIIGTPTKPVINSGSNGWSKNNIVEIQEDSNARGKIKYYLYCIVDEKDPTKCKWKKTTTKNIVVTEDGKHYVYFRAVDEDGRKGKISDPIEVFVDSTAPEILKVEKEVVSEDSVKVKVEAKDALSGIDKYYFKLENGEYVDSKTGEYIFSGLEQDKDYQVTVRVVDKAGNEKEITFTIRIDSNKEKEENKDDDKDKNKIEEEQEEVKEIPELSLSGVPSKFIEGKNYALPTSYKFGKSGGSVVCYVDKEEKSSTKSIGIGIHNIECIAESNTGVRVREAKK